MSYLEFKDLTVEFNGFRAVNGINLSIDKGEIRVIIGPNGAGKTTIIDMITGKTQPTYGAVLLDNQIISGKRPYQVANLNKIGRKFQGPNVFDYMTVYENLEVAYGGYTSLLKTILYRRKPEIVEELDEILKQINLYEQKDEYPLYLSHGQRQWLEIGMVLAQKPEIITLDEPTAGMSVEETFKTGELIKTIMEDKTVIVIEHDIDFVKQIASTITVLNQGEILAEGTYDEITNNPEVIKVYLKSDDED